MLSRPDTFVILECLPVMPGSVSDGVFAQKISSHAFYLVHVMQSECRRGFLAVALLLTLFCHSIRLCHHAQFNTIHLDAKSLLACLSRGRKGDDADTQTLRGWFHPLVCSRARLSM